MMSETVSPKASKTPTKTVESRTPSTTPRRVPRPKGWLNKIFEDGVRQFNKSGQKWPKATV